MQCPIGVCVWGGGGGAVGRFKKKRGALRKGPQPPITSAPSEWASGFGGGVGGGGGVHEAVFKTNDETVTFSLVLRYFKIKYIIPCKTVAGS